MENVSGKSKAVGGSWSNLVTWHHASGRPFQQVKRGRSGSVGRILAPETRHCLFLDAWIQAQYHCCWDSNGVQHTRHQRQTGVPARSADHTETGDTFRAPAKHGEDYAAGATPAQQRHQAGREVLHGGHVAAGGSIIQIPNQSALGLVGTCSGWKTVTGAGAYM